MFVLKKNKLSIERLYNLKIDKAEIVNLVNKKDFIHIIKSKNANFKKREKIYFKKEFL